jgi:predicted enzyme related to lactoylglutathione lyase
MPRVVHFDIPADDPDRAAKFYQEVFGWKISKWAGPMDYWLVSTGEPAERGIDGGLTRRAHAGAATVNTIDVPSVDDFVSRIEKSGGKVVAPKMPIPGVGYLAYCLDTEGNTFGVMQAEPNAH